MTRDAPILIVCSARSELMDGGISWGTGNATSLLLEPLAEAEADRLIDNLLGDADLPESVRDYIIETSGGNPLYVEELLANLVDRDLLKRADGRWTTTQVPVIPLPATIQALVSSRIDRLPEAERMTLELAAVAGMEFGRSTVRELADDELRSEVDGHLAALVRKELVRPRPPTDEQYAFRHQLVRAAAYDSMPLPARAELHGRIADQLERVAGDDGLVAYHRDLAARSRVTLGDV
jgi:predicted ATPase